MKGSKANWVSTSFVDGAFVPKEVEIIDGLVPNVYGMAAVDALYLLENSGLRVMLYGSGRVVSQSIPPGVKVKKGEIYFNWDNYKFGNSFNELTKYCNNYEYGLNGFTDNLANLQSEDDVAYQNKKFYNFKFHIPTNE